MRDPRHLIEGERALAGGPLDVPSQVELDRLLPGILDAAAPEPKSRFASLWSRALAGTGALAAVAAALFFVVVPHAKNEDDTFIARGSTHTGGFSLFCVDPAAPAPVELVFDNSSCARGAKLVVSLPSSPRWHEGEVTVTDANLDTVLFDQRGVAIGDDGVFAKPIDLKPSFPAGKVAVILRIAHGPGFMRYVELK